MNANFVSAEPIPVSTTLSKKEELEEMSESIQSYKSLKFEFVS